MIEIEKSAYKSIIIMCKNEEMIISEGNSIQFVSEFTGEKKIGTLTKIIGKGEKTQIQIIPKDCQYEEIWPLIAIREDTLKLNIEK